MGFGLLNSGGHGFCKGQIAGGVNDHLELITGRQQLWAGRAMGLGGEGDPGKLAAQAIDATGFQVQRQGLTLAIEHLGREGGAEAVEVVVQGFATGDHHKGGPGLGCAEGGRGDRGQGLVWVRLLGPGVFGVAPAAAHPAAAQANEKSAAARVKPFPLQGMEGFYDWEGTRRWRGWHWCLGWAGPAGCGALLGATWAAVVGRLRPNPGRGGGACQAWIGIRGGTGRR